MMITPTYQQTQPFHHHDTQSYPYDEQYHHHPIHHHHDPMPASPSSGEGEGQRQLLYPEEAQQHILGTAVNQSDRTSVEFVRCLQQTRHILREMQLLCGQICTISTTRDDVWDSLELFKTLFVKFLRLSNMLLTILSQMETSPIIRPERINSFRADIWDDCRSAADLRSRVLLYLGQDGGSSSPASPSPSQQDDHQQLPRQQQS
ncbi:hypothetical protein BCR43DRAFT_498807 [Syncephalastrum racemosum]|uniref:Uncharacterized protein n=1 Tax=Syncephalastrum racemosum TaxID=13706 RepID=A0A1X2H1I1_SYNRA|nr:hypothetical protein BCR43DRAFT_498807 [Syncephalastrum racemosum]